MITLMPKRRTLPTWVKPAAHWIAGAVFMWVGLSAAMAGHGLYQEEGASTAASVLLGWGGGALIVIGALIWRRGT